MSTPRRRGGPSCAAWALALALFAGAGGAQQLPASAPAAGEASQPAAGSSPAEGAAAETAGVPAAPRTAAAGSDKGVLRPFAAAAGATAAPWRLALLPNQTKPKTQFRVVDIDGHRALRVEANLSYGNLLHPLKLTAGTSARLSWRWKVELLNPAADLRSRGGDDTTLKVCTLWDEPIERLSFGERQLLRVARATAGEPVPAASICYVWDAKLAEGTELDSPFTRRLRYIVLRRGSAAGGSGWVTEKRDIAADFLRLFGDESPTLPPLAGVAVGADADNTQGRSVGYVADLSLEP